MLMLSPPLLLLSLHIRYAAAFRLFSLMIIIAAMLFAIIDIAIVIATPFRC